MLIVPALGVLVLAGLAAGESNSYSVGQGIGRAIGTLLFSALLGWIAFRVAGRSVTAGSIVTIVLVFLGVAGGLLDSFRQHWDEANIDSAVSSMKDALEEYGEKSRDAEEYADQKAANEQMREQVMDSISALGNSSEPELRKMMEAVQEVAQDLTVTAQKADDTALALAENPFPPSDPAEYAEGIAHELKLLDAAEQAVLEQKAAVQSYVRRVTEKVNGLDVASSSRRDFLAGFRRGSSESIQSTLRVNDAILNQHQVYRQFLEFLQDHLGQWEIDPADGLYVWPTDELVDQFNGHMDQVIQAESKANAAFEAHLQFMQRQAGGL